MTFGAIKARIADELVRPDLTDQIALAVNDAIKEAATYRFWFNEVRGLTFPMVADQSLYDESDLADIAYISRIDVLWITVNGQRRNLELRNNLQVNGWLEGQTDLSGEPAYYARSGNGLQFYMPPNEAYTVTIDGTTRFAELAADEDENPYLTEGEKYIRALAKAQILENVVRGDSLQEADRQWALAERERRILIGETSGRVSVGSNMAFL